MMICDYFLVEFSIGFKKRNTPSNQSTRFYSYSRLDGGLDNQPGQSSNSEDSDVAVWFWSELP